MPYCEKCGNQVNAESKFCRSCGAKLTPTAQATPVQAQPVAYPPPPPPPQVTATPPQSVAQPQTLPQGASSEQTIGAIVLRKPKSFGRWDTFTGVLTSQQLIIAQMTSDMLKDAAMQARDQAKAEGKGFWGQWSEQLKTSFNYTKRYLTMTPAAILAETPGNFAINNNTIKEIKFKIKHLGSYDESSRKEWEVEIHSSMGKYEYRMDDNSQFVDLFKKAYPNRVKTPMGYFSKTVNIKL
jgi:hypothetical protein